ncbi:uncharacterized protein LOC128244079 [Mya arenaria]|uniref:uncharacterized protein LOC128244079 n=1 Tax=Mya arenaria TaxID=6604 RepID=UPI0022E4B528|nr:uncharacterized protein LOC128244079 [Mya arenaria]
MTFNGYHADPQIDVKDDDSDVHAKQQSIQDARNPNRKEAKLDLTYPQTYEIERLPSATQQQFENDRTNNRTKGTSSSFKNKVFNTKFGPMDMKTIEEIYNKTRYTTCAQKAAAEVSIPMFKIVPPKTTQEARADMVRLGVRRYEEAPADWQQAFLWDRIQSRCPEDFRLRSAEKERLLNRSEKKCPGYAGYTPLCLPETNLESKLGTSEGMTSLMKASYRKIPEKVLTKLEYARKGTFSQALTLTSPFNPFNKVGQEILVMDKESQFRNMREYMGKANIQ